MRKFLFTLLYNFYKLINYPQILRNGVSLGKNVHIRGLLYVKTVKCEKGSIVISDGVNINSSLSSDPIGGETRTILYTRRGGKIIIGNNAGISNTTLVADTSITIGEYSNLGGGVKVYDTDFHSLNSEVRLNGDTDIKSKPVVIGKRVFVGGHSIILKGVTIGDDAVIGAGSVVAKNVPSGEIWAGNPAKFIRKVKTDK